MSGAPPRQVSSQRHDAPLTGGGSTPFRPYWVILEPAVTAAQIDRRTAEAVAHADDDIETILRRLGKANAKAIDILSGVPESTFDTQTNRGTAEGAFKALVLRHVSEHAEQITETRATVKNL